MNKLFIVLIILISMSGICLALIALTSSVNMPVIGINQDNLKERYNYLCTFIEGQKIENYNCIQNTTYIKTQGEQGDYYCARENIINDKKITYTRTTYLNEEFNCVSLDSISVRCYSKLKDAKEESYLCKKIINGGVPTMSVEEYMKVHLGI